MVTSTPIILATSVGITLSTAFSIGSLAFSYVTIPAILLPSDAPLMPPLVLEPGAKSSYDTDQAPRNPLDSGIGDKSESILDSGATSKHLRGSRKGSGSPSSSSYLLRQWFHLFSKGMHSLPPFALGSAACYIFCGVMLPGPLAMHGPMIVKRVLYMVATVLSAGIMVFTQTALKPTNDALHERVKEVVEQEKESRDMPNVDDKRAETEDLIREWGRINAVRALMPLFGVASAILALVL